MKKIAIIAMIGCALFLAALGSEALAEDGDQVPLPSVAPPGSPISYNPTLVGPMYADDDGFTIALVDQRSPAGTMYKVTATDPDQGRVIGVSEWSTSRCRRFEGFSPNAWHRFEITAMNPSGYETTPTEYFIWVWGDDAWETTPTDEDAWLSNRIAEVADIYSLSAKAEDMMLDLPIKIHRNEPGHASYWGINRGVGLGLATHPWTFAHEFMHAFWEHWDGFPLPCDQMNILTFRRDLTEFMLAFMVYESTPEDPNPLEEYRAYFNWLVDDFPSYTGPSGEDAITLLLRTYWIDGFFEPDIWHLVFHLADTDPPMTALGRPFLLPPTIARYFKGFIETIEEAEPTTWDDYIDDFSTLSLEDSRLIIETSRFHGRLLSGNIITPPEVETTIREPLRTRARRADRQGLIDFVNTLEDMACNPDCEPLWEADPEFWYVYSIKNLIRIILYMDELDNTGIELSSPNWASMREALEALPTCGDDATIEETLSLILSLGGITENQRTALVEVLSDREQAHWFCDVWGEAEYPDAVLDLSVFGYLPEASKQLALSSSWNCSRLSTTSPPDFGKPSC